MSPARRLPLAVVCLLWAGVVIGISFIEAPVKFRTPTLTRSVAFDVGRTVFRASQWAQLGFAALALCAAVAGRVPRWAWACLGLAVATLVLQMACIFPVLDGRARVLIAGGVPSGASPHALYGGLELLKVLALLAAALLSLQASREGG